MKIKDAIMVIVGLALLWCVVSAIRPYWDKYWLEQEIRAVAIFGTKNSVEDIRRLLTRKMIEIGHGFSGEDFAIERDEDNNVTISIEYIDEIRVFGVTLKELEMTVEETVSEVEAMF